MTSTFRTLVAVAGDATLWSTLNGRLISRVEIQRVYRLVLENREALLRSWHEYFGN